ncbi:MAG: type II toxin-antitoxin system VapB family antitoxin [Bryobacteraceae bacterium]
MASVKKTWLIDPELVRRARKICGARTETETVTRALREIIVRHEIEKAFQRQGPRWPILSPCFPILPFRDNDEGAARYQRFDRLLPKPRAKKGIRVASTPAAAVHEFYRDA